MWVWPRDPLVLDLDADGIETTGIDPNAPILFDHDADGSRTATGWIKPDDALLVRDVNGNGQIDNGRELFGDNTLLANGANAANGYAALADLDSNANGQMDAGDAAFAELRLWQDANQDGLAQAGELRSLTQAGIASIGVAGTATTTNLGNGNTQPWSGSFIRSNGAVGESGAASLSGSLLLASNNFYREFTDDPVVTEAADALPQMGGSGWVRDLREAMSLGTPEAQALQDQVAAFSAAGSRDAQRAMLDEMIAAWGATTGRMLTSTTTYLFKIAGTVQTTFDPDSITAGEAQNSTYLNLWVAGLNAVDTLPNGGDYAYNLPEGQEVLRRLNVLEVFNGEKFVQLSLGEGTNSGLGGGLRSSDGGGGGGAASGPRFLNASLTTTQTDLLNQSYEALRESVYTALLLQTRLKPYLDSIELVIDEDGLRFDATALDALLNDRRAANGREALIDLAELNRFTRDTLFAIGYRGLDKLAGWVNDLPADSSLRADLAEIGVVTGTAVGTKAVELYLGDHTANTFSGGGGDDQMDGGAGDDALAGGEGRDYLYGGLGSDQLSGDDGDDVLAGQDGADTLTAGAGNDTLDGGAGNDSLASGTGNDVFLFGRGDGQDTLEADYDLATGKTNTLQFKAGVSAADVTVRRAGGGLVLSIADINGATPDSITIPHFFFQDDAGNYLNPLQEVRFADGTVWDLAALASLAMTGTAQADILTGTLGADTLRGLAGDDSLAGGEGADLLDGGDGTDTLNAGGGDDTLDGGAGDDALAGGTGNDVVLFGRGDGQDSLGADYDLAPGKLNTLQFKAGVGVNDITVRRAGGGLVLSIAGINGATPDSLTVPHFFFQDDAGNYLNPLQQVRFADGTVWDLAALQARTTLGTSGADSLSGTLGADILRGLAGDDSLNGGDGADLLEGGDGTDTLNAGGGDDTLDGGAGDDALASGTGNDVFLFGRGDGQDTAGADYDLTPGKLNTLQFKAGVAPTAVTVRRAGGGLVLSIAGINGATPDSFTVPHFFFQDDAGNYLNPLQQVRFADGTVWDLAALTAKAMTGTAGADVLVGTNGADTLLGQAGNDSLSGGAGNDSLNGGTGADTMAGGAGDDAYWIDDAGDVINEGWGEGVDAVRTSIDYTLPTNVETLTLTGTTLNGTGNASANTLIGNPAANRLSGGAGDDLLLGDAGNDTLLGGEGNDSLNGGVGADTMTGGLGDDAYWIDDAGDVITELAGEGVDAVRTSIDATLAANLESLTLTGTSALNATGNAGANTLVGNTGANILAGGEGADLLLGGAGNDTYRLHRGWGAETVVDTDSTAGNLDIAQFGPGITADQLWFRQTGNHLEVSVIGTADKLTVNNWFAGSQHHVEQFKAGDGRMLLDTQVHLLIQAMASFSPPPMGTSHLTGSTQTTLAPLIAANWQ